MQLNLDCVRSILLCVEENTGVRSRCQFIDTALDKSLEFLGHSNVIQEYQEKLLTTYTNDELIYHINYCNSAGLITLHNATTPNLIVVSDLTPAGHNFLCNIRENKIWTGVKGVAAKIGTKSLDAVIQIASNVITELIRSQFKL